MANYIATTEQFTATADAIRAKTGSSADLEWDALTGYADDIAAISAGVDTSDATAVAGDILSGKTAYVDGSKVTGTIATKAAATYNASTSDQTIAAGQYLAGAQTIRKITTSNITAANIKKGVVVKVGDSGSSTRIKNVTGTYDGDTFAFISVTYPAGSTCTATNGTKTLTAPDTSGIALFRIQTPTSLPESWTVSCTDGTDSTSAIVSITYEGQSEDVDLAYIPPLESFATASDANFVKIIQAAHNGKINLQTDAGWKVGDKRTISISAFIGGGNISHNAQSIDIAISSFENYENCGCVMQFDFVDELAAGNRMNSSNTNTGGYGASEMYTTTLPALVNALPAYLRDLLIEFICKASAGSKSTTIQTITGNKLALRSEVEIFGTTTYSIVGEGLQIPYYTTTANRIKKRGHSGSADLWWERSPDTKSFANFCRATTNGSSISYTPTNANGVAPFGCI